MIVQFGTSGFLQTHVDTFASQARDAGQVVPGIVIVQTTRDRGRTRRLAGFAYPAGFPVVIRRVEGGSPIKQTVQVGSVADGLHAAKDWSALAAEQGRDPAFLS